MVSRNEHNEAGNTRAIELMSSFRARLYVDAMELCHDPIMAESLVLHAIDSALRNYSAEEVGGYNLLKTILKNAWHNENRRLVDQATTSVDMDEMEETLVSNVTEDEILRNSDSEALKSAINRLAPEFKKTVVMHYLMDMPLKEIAKVLHRPIGTVKWRLSVAKDVLAGMLKKTLGRPGTWMLLLVGLITGCVATYCIMRLPPRKQSDPTGGIAYNTPKVHEIIVHRAPKEVKIDGDLLEWNAPVFETSCNPPYDRDYCASIRMMWDEKYLYIGGDIRTPDPMRNKGLNVGLCPFAGGSVICRLSADPSLELPLSEKTVYNELSPPQEPLPDQGLVSIILYYNSSEGEARLFAYRCMRCAKPIAIPCGGYGGAYRKHRDGRGYAFEYAIDWRKAGIVPPKPGETRANTWNIHFSDREGIVCTGQLAENIVSPLPENYSNAPTFSCCFYPPTWGKVEFSSNQ